MPVIKDPDDLSGYSLAPDEKKVTLTAYSDHNSTDITLPAYVDGKPLRRIGFGAFRGVPDLRVVIIPDTVKFIDNSAFRACPDLESVVMFGAESISQYAFAECKNLKSIAMPSNVMGITNKTFCKSYKLTEFVIFDADKGAGRRDDEKYEFSKKFAVACLNETRRIRYVNAVLQYFDNYSMDKYDEGFPLIAEYEDRFNIAEFRLRNPDQLTPQTRFNYESEIAQAIPHILRDDDVSKLSAAGEFGLIEERRIDEFIEKASLIKGSCLAYLLEYKEKRFARREVSFEL